MSEPMTADAPSQKMDAIPSDVVVETRNLAKVYRDFWGRQKVNALKARNNVRTVQRAFDLFKVGQRG